MSTPTPPEPPTVVNPPDAKPPWWQRKWGVITIGAVAAILGIGIGGAAGGNTKTVTETKQAVAQTVTQTVTTKSPNVVVHTHTATVTSAPTPETEPEASGSGEVQSYSGNGGKSLGTVKVEKESNLEWTNDGSYFGIYSSEGVPVTSSAHSGTTVLEPGTYSKFQINAIGNWTMKIVPK